MHITPPRVLGFLMFLALIGYAFFLGPRITAASTQSTHSPATSVTAPKPTPSGTPSTPDTQGTQSAPAQASLPFRAE